jgi:putative endonuclease
MRAQRPDPPRPADWRGQPAVFWVYVIRSQSSGMFYVGQTDDVQGRVRQHNEPQKNRSLFTTRNLGPWVLVHQERCSSRREAMKLEKRIKGRGVSRHLKEIARQSASGC